MGGFSIQKHKEITNVETRQDTSLGVMRWGTDNSFPQTLRNLVNQSPLSRPAILRTAKFFRGGNFEGQDTIVTPYGLTLKDLVAILSDDLATLDGFAIHSNYNIKGESTSMNPMRIAELRFKEFDELNFSNKIGYHPNFGHNAVEVKTIKRTVTKGNIKWFDRFNPKFAIKQIEKTDGGIGNYLGQILYHTDSGHSSYPIPPLQAPINYVLADIENSILVRKETSTGFIQAYLLKTSLSSDNVNLMALETAIEDAQGARGTGKVITMSGLPPEDLAATVLEELAGGKNTAIIDSASKGYDLSSKIIWGAYLIPTVLAGGDAKTGFSSESLKDAYFVFNTITQGGRDTIEQKINQILAVGKFGVDSIKLNRLVLDDIEGAEEVTTVSLTDFLSAYVSSREKETGKIPSPKELIRIVNIYKAEKEASNE